MNNPMRYAVAVWAAALVIGSGCSSTPQHDWGYSSSWSRFFGHKPATAGVAVSPREMPAANPATSATQSVSKAFQTAGEKVASALNAKPKVIPAKDPAKLSSQPEHLTPSLYIQAAQLSESQGAMAQAQRQYEKALELDPRDVRTLIAWARFCDRQGRPDEALRHYERARSLAPASTIVLNDIGLFHARHGNLPAALEALDQAVRLDPQNVRYRNNLAAALVESQRVAEAVDVLRAVHPEATALFNTACLLAITNETSAAAALLEQSLRIDPSQTAAREMLQDLRGESRLAQSANPPPNKGDSDRDRPAPPRYETASRLPIVWESKPAPGRPYSPLESEALPRKLPVND